MKRLSTLVTLVGSLLVAGTLGVACSHQQRGGATQPPPRPLGESTAMGPSDPTRELEVPQTKAPPIENVPTLSSPTPGAAPTTTTTPGTPAPTAAETVEPPSPSPTAPHVPNPLPPQAPPANPPTTPTPPPPVTQPPVTQPAPSVPPSMLPMQVRSDAGVGTPPPPPAPVRDAGTILPRDASPTPPPTVRTDARAIPISPR